MPHESLSTLPEGCPPRRRKRLCRRTVSTVSLLPIRPRWPMISHLFAIRIRENCRRTKKRSAAPEDCPFILREKRPRLSARRRTSRVGYCAQSILVRPPAP